MKEWIHEGFMYLRETALLDREKNLGNLKIQFNARAAINEPEILYGDEDMMAFSHLVVKKNIKKQRVTQVQLYKAGKVRREISNAINT